MKLREREKQNWGERLKTRKSNIQKKKPRQLDLEVPSQLETNRQIATQTPIDQPNHRPNRHQSHQAEASPLIPTAPVPTVPIQDFNEKLKELFTNPKFPTSYSHYLKMFFRQNPTLSRHAPARKRFKRRKMIVNGPFCTYQMDLIFYESLRSQNKGYKYILAIIDCFSRKAWVKEIKSKKATEVRDVLVRFLDQLNTMPQDFYSDEGGEFVNSQVNELFRKRGISHYILRGTHKAAIVERFNRTFRTSLELYMDHNKTKNWVDGIQDLVDAYNNRVHRSIGMTPNSVNLENFRTVYKRLYPRIGAQKICYFKKGDRVRVAIKKPIFEKGFRQTFSDEIYKIEQTIKSRGLCWYIVVDLEGNNKQKAYFHQLKLVQRENDIDST